MSNKLRGRQARILTGKCAGMTGRIIQEPMGARQLTTVMVGTTSGVGLVLPLDELQLADTSDDDAATPEPA